MHFLAISPQMTMSRIPGTRKPKHVHCYDDRHGKQTSAEYKNMAESTRDNYRRVLERFRKEHGAKPLARLETRHINAIIDKASERTTEAPRKTRRQTAQRRRLAAASVLTLRTIRSPRFSL